jgi:molybdate transport system substrate-binding protein
MLGLAMMIAKSPATELRVLAGGGIAAPLKEIAAQFETTAGHKVAIRFGTSPELIKMAARGSFDLAIVPVDVFTDLPTRALFETSPTLLVARAGIGVAVRSGAAKPDISTREALTQTLLEARAIASIPASATGALLVAIYERLGIAEEMKTKIKAQPGPTQVIEAVVNGEADLAVFLTNVLADPRLDIVGPLPAEIQREVIYRAALATNSKDRDVAKAFIAYLVSPAGAAIIKSKGMAPLR